LNGFSCNEINVGEKNIGFNFDDEDDEWSYKFMHGWAMVLIPLYPSEVNGWKGKWIF